MQGEGQQPPLPSPAAAAAAISSVLGNDDLLGEILLRLAFPTCLVRAALVCKRWLRAASGPAFLRRFRDLHPPRLLGFYVCTSEIPLPQFVPIHQPPELTSAVRRAASVFDAFVGHNVRILDCRARDNRLLIRFYGGNGAHKRAVLSPLLYPGRFEVIEPQPTIFDLGNIYHPRDFLPDDASDGVQCFYMVQVFSESQAAMKVKVCKDGVWAIHTSVTTDLLESPRMLSFLLINNKLYMATVKNILVLDLASSSFFVINSGHHMLSQADNYGIYLIRLNGLQLHVWLHRTDNDSVDNWLLVDTICFQEVCANAGMPVWQPTDGHDDLVRLSCVGDNAEFVLLRIGNWLFYLNIWSRTVEKMYEWTPEVDWLLGTCPCVMIWPPSFPAMKERRDQEERYQKAQDSSNRGWYQHSTSNFVSEYKKEDQVSFAYPMP